MDIDAIVAELEEWHSVFGHLSKDADEAGNMIFAQQREQQRRIEQLEGALRGIEQLSNVLLSVQPTYIDQGTEGLRHLLRKIHVAALQSSLSGEEGK